MGRDRTTSDEKRANGNPGRRTIPDEYEVKRASVRCPRNLTALERRYWRLWAKPLIEIGRLTSLNLPSFLTLIQMKARLDKLNIELRNEPEAIMQTDVFVDSSGQEHTKLRESARSRLSRDMWTAVHRLEKSWGLTADSMAGLFKAKQNKSDMEKLLD